MIDLVKNYSVLARRMKKSVIRELLKVTSRPGLISFAGGLPDPTAFPVEVMEDICTSVIRDHGKTAFQYGQTEGLDLLKSEIIKQAELDGMVGIKPENLLVTVASQQGLDLIGRIFIDAGDPIIVESPSYLGGLQAFKAYGAQMFGVPMDDQGIRTDLLRKRLMTLRDQEEHYKFVYTIPDFQNPSGITLCEERRRQIVDLAREFNFLIIEDSPYRELRYSGEPVPYIQNLDDQNNTITLCTFSKIFVPGLRLGWIVANEGIINKMVVAKQSMDLCTPPFNQFLAYEFCRRGLLRAHIEKVKVIYKNKRDAMLHALKEHMPEHEDLTWTHPDGGLFLWVRLPKHMSADDMFLKAVDNKVAYVIGSAFHCDETGQNTMRLNFSYPTVEEIDTGVQRLAQVIKEYI